MVVWQGITSDGNATPVQVTEDGKVVAQGESGAQGPPGPPGADSQVPGPQGPPGVDGKDGKDGKDGVAATNDPFNGAFLTFRNNEIVWANLPQPIFPSPIYRIQGVNKNGSSTVLNVPAFVEGSILEGDLVTQVNEQGIPAYPYAEAVVTNIGGALINVGDSDGWQTGMWVMRRGGWEPGFIKALVQEIMEYQSTQDIVPED